jgi:hypothetical protein
MVVLSFAPPGRMKPVNRNRSWSGISYAVAIGSLSAVLVFLALYNPKADESASIQGPYVTSGDVTGDPGLLALDGFEH